MPAADHLSQASANVGLVANAENALCRRVRQRFQKPAFGVDPWSQAVLDTDLIRDLLQSTLAIVSAVWRKLRTKGLLKGTVLVSSSRDINQL